MNLSVVICSYDRYNLVHEAVNAVLRSASFDGGTMELIVVENTPACRRRALDFGPLVRVIVCEDPGLSHARNAGVGASAAAIVAFVDDDAMVSDKWCAAVLEAFNAFPGAMVCGGKTFPRFSSSFRPHWYFDDLDHHLSCIDWGPKAQPLSRGQWIVGANMAFRRSVFERVGRFDPSLGRKGDASLLSNEETEMLRRIGHEHVYYIPDMTAEHIVPDGRVSLEWFRKRVFWQAVSDVLAQDIHITPQQAIEELYDLVSRMPAEVRGHRLLSFEPADPGQFREQLRAVYLQTLAMTAGFSKRLGER